MYGFGELISVLKKNPKTIVFTEGTDPRILEASSRLLASNFLHPILIGNEDEIYKGAEESGFNIRGAEIIITILRLSSIWRWSHYRSRYFIRSLKKFQMWWSAIV